MLVGRAFQDALCPPPPRRLTVGEQMYPGLVADCDDVIAHSLKDTPGGMSIDLEFRWHRVASAKQYTDMANALNKMDGAFIMKYFGNCSRTPRPT